DTYPKPALRFVMTAVVAIGLTACASGPTDNISRIPVQTADQTSKDGLFTQSIKTKRTKPDCQGECPTLEVDSLVFPGVPILTELVDHALAMMTGVSDSSTPPYATIAEYETYFWQTAGPRDSTLLSAKTRYRNRSLTVIELNTWQ